LVDDLRSFLIKDIDKNLISKELAKKYNVSQLTMNIRINSLLDQLPEVAE